MLEFTGERVIPGLVDPNLLDEHLARYRFAALFARGSVVLDAGCGSGYGIVELGAARRVVALDLSAAAVAHARQAFGRAGVDFLQGTCEALPFANESFDLIVAFEVIEHLERWQEMLVEARRVLRGSGILLVSTPNRVAYAESRAAAGPNPFHVREFDHLEFRSALEAVFPEVQLWTQNHAEAILFAHPDASSGVLDGSEKAEFEHADFFFAACSRSPIPESRPFAWVAAGGNILRERERHINLLESEIRRKDAWLHQSQQNVAALQAEVEERNSWAERLDGELNQARSLIADLQAEAAARLRWIADLESQIARGRTQIESMERTIVERTVWAQSLDADVERLQGESRRLQGDLERREQQLRAIGQSKWIRFGKKLHLGPVVG